MAFGSGTISSLSGAATDLFFAPKAYEAKARGSEFEKKNYLLAADYAEQNVKFTEQSTAIKLAQNQRDITKTIGGQQAQVAGAGYAASGTALDLLRESASQGALTQQVLAAQGQITEAGYKQQAQSYQNMASAAQVAIDADREAASNSMITGVLKLGAAAFSVGTGGLSDIAGSIGSSLMGGGSPSGYGSG